MNKCLTKYLVNKLIDWLVALFGAAVIIWFFLTQPIFWAEPTHRLSLDISTSELKKHVVMLAEDFAPRTREYGNLNITAHYIHDELSKFGEVENQSYSTLGGSYSNILLELGPDTQELFVIGAHYDAESSSLDIEGNASGVATLIELARHLSKAEDKLPLKVQFVAYPLSQRSLKDTSDAGSYNHADSLKKSDKKIRLMVSLDGVGHFNNEENTQKYPYKFMHLFYPDKGNYISLIGRLQDYSVIRRMKKSFTSASSLPIYSFNVPDNFSPTNSYDHVNYQRNGFPAILLTDTAKYRQSNEGAKGVVEQLDFEKMAMIVQSLYQIVMDNEPAVQVVQLANQVKNKE